MQIIEATDAYVRIVELRLRRPGSALQFLLYPMLHVGSPQFYGEVTRRIAACDVVVAEGVTGPSPAGKALASSYRAIAENDELVVQNIDYGSLGVPVINPDWSGETFEARWRELPLWQRTAAQAVARTVAGAHRLVGTGLLRYQLRNSSMDDEPDLHELFAPQAVENVLDVIVRQRDEPLVEALLRLHHERAAEAITVAVVYGAGHMRAVLNQLYPHGYRVVSGDWIEVLSF